LDRESNDLEALRALVRQLAQRMDVVERKLDTQLPTPGTPAAASPMILAAHTEEPQVSPAQAPVSAVPPAPDIAEGAPAPPPRTPTATERAQSSQREVRSGDLESRIGSHWLNRIGITAVLIGVSYFLKYAFDNNWIGASGRVGIGLLAGIAIVAWSERFRSRGYIAFSFSLKAVGIGALYLSLWAAFQLYSLIPSSVAFAAMLVVTASTAVLAVVQDAEILAAFALTGGFTTPLLISTGQNHEVALFSYVAVLDAATLVLVARKPWRRLLLLSYAATLLLYIAWYSTYYRRSELEVTLGFASFFFVMFAIAPLIARRTAQTGFFATLPLFLAFVNAGVYFLQVYAMFESVDKPFMAWFALGLAAVYLYLSKLAKERYPDPENAQKLQLLHLALAIGFITIAIPIRLDGHWITLGWFVEAAVLLWIADRIKSDFLIGFAIAALALGVVRLLALDNFDTASLIFNSRMLTYGVAIAVLGLMAWFGAKRKDEPGRQMAMIAVVCLNALALVASSREVSDYYTRQQAALPRQPYQDWASSPWRRLHIAEAFTYSALWMAYGAMLMIIGFWRRSAFVRWQALFLIAATIVKVFVYDVSELDRGYRIVSFIVLGVLLLAISFVYQKGWLQLSEATEVAKEHSGA
jgi:uncharacterized membrane protein